MTRAAVCELAEHVRQDDIKRADLKYGFDSVNCRQPNTVNSTEVGHEV